MDELLLSSSHQNAPWDNIFHGSPSVASVQQASAFHLNDAALVVSPFQNGGEPSCNNRFMQAVSSEDVTMQYCPNFFASTLNFSGIDSVQTSNEILPNNNSELMLGISPGSLAQANSNVAGTLVFVSALPSPVPESSIASPFSAFLNFDEPSSGLREPQSPVKRNFWDAAPANRIIFYGRNPVDIIPAVQMIDTLFQHCQHDTFQLRIIPRTSPSSEMLADEIRGEIFLSQIDDVATWAYNAAADSTRRRRNTRKLGYYSDISPLPALYQEDDLRSNVQSGSVVSSIEHSMRASGLACYCEGLTDSPMGGTLRMQVWREPQNASNNGTDSLCYISIFAISKVRVRSEAAIKVTFPIKIHNMPMYTTIRTFNVVPYDSKIIQCVKVNDLDGFRRLISENKASPRDVDPEGWSLLTVGL
jgi:hypothetical protein